MLNVVCDMCSMLKYPALLLFGCTLSIGKGDYALDFLLSGLIFWTIELSLEGL